VFDAVMAPADLDIRDAFYQPVACTADAAPAGGTALRCPVGLEYPWLDVSARASPALAVRGHLSLQATVANDLPERAPADNVASGSASIIARADLCVGAGCSPSPTPYPVKLEPEQSNLLQFDLANLGPSTAREAVAIIQANTPAAGLAVGFQGQPCAPAQSIGNGLVEVRCALGDLAGDRSVYPLTAAIHTAGLSGDVTLRLQVTSAVPDESPANNLREFRLPIVPVVDLSSAVSVKRTRFPGPAVFSVSTAAEGPATDALSELVLRIESPGAADYANLYTDGPGWLCSPLVYTPDLQEWLCGRYLPLAAGVPGVIGVEVPANRFAQIGRAIRVTAHHRYPANAPATDRTPANDASIGIHVVDGRRTQSVKPPVAKVARRPDPGTANADAPADLCLSFQGSHCDTGSDYPVLIAEGGRARLPFAVVNRGTGTAVNARVVFDLSLPRGLFEFDDGNQLCPEPVMLGTIARFTCFIGDLPADGSVKTLWMSVDATTLTTVDKVGLVAVARTDSVDPVTSNNQRNLQIPVYPAADLRLTLQPKGEGRYPSPQHFLIEAGIAGTSAQRHLVEVVYDVEGLRTPPRVTSDHWNCTNSTYTFLSSKLICRPRWSLAPDEMTQIAIAFQPDFRQIGRPIAVRARHVFDFGAVVADPTAEDARSQSQVVVGGRSTLGVKKPVSTSPTPAGAGSPRRAVHAPRPGRASAQR
jgi:hypothetical protein